MRTHLKARFAAPRIPANRSEIVLGEDLEELYFYPAATLTAARKKRENPMTKRYVEVPEDAVIYDPNTNEPAHLVVTDASGKPILHEGRLQFQPELDADGKPVIGPDGAPVLKIQTQSFANYIRILCMTLFKESKTPMALVDLRQDLSGTPGHSTKPGDIIEIQDSDEAWKSLVELAQNPAPAFMPESLACILISYKPFVHALLGATLTKPAPKAEKNEKADGSFSNTASSAGFSASSSAS
jgi:hypothetical protein